MMSYSSDSDCNKSIIGFYTHMFSKMPHNEWEKLSEKTKINLNSFLEGNVDTKWYVSIYKRYSFFRGKNKLTHKGKIKSE